ncbi:MAG: 23S rRNA (guanosine(2251)-2'-O)-methyltransferase RlmB [Bacteroidales bacterium]|nr:23S rRNA (guanosine(2251)-2'-O)-methyltransferase RlmB [Bacteroidales bacterium]
MKQTDNLIYGIRPAIESIRAGKEFDKLFIQKGLRGEHIAELFTLLREYQIPFQYVPLEKLNRLTRKNHQGVVGFISAIAFQPIEEVVQMIFEKGETPLILILDGVTDVRNFGAIARTAEIAGVHGILFPTQGSAQINADAMKTSAGALNNIPVCRTKNLSQSIDYLKNCGLQLVAASEKAETSLYKVNFIAPTAIIMGSEEDGVSPAYLKKCDHQVRIPMKGKTASLNVSVASALLVYEVLRQRGLEELQ